MQGLLKTLGQLPKEGHKLLTDIDMYYQKAKAGVLLSQFSTKERIQAL